MPVLNVECIICSHNFENGDDVYSTQCGHLFHFSCLRSWTSKNPSCPNCRANNPQSHKLFLTFDESKVDSALIDEYKAKESSVNEQMTNLIAEKEKVEANFMIIQQQFTLSEKLNKELELKVQQMTDFESGFYRLQEEYTKAETKIRDLKNQVQQQFNRSESASAELHRKTMENEYLKETLKNSSLHRIKNLEQKLEHVSGELEKEIALSTQLSIDKMKLESCAKLLKKMEGTNDTTVKQSSVKSNCEQKENDQTMGNIDQSDDVYNNTVIIHGLKSVNLNFPLENIIVYLALKMKITMSATDLYTVSLGKSKNRKLNTNHLIAQFKDTNLKDNFLRKKQLLKNDIETKFLRIYEFMSDDLFLLFKYAKEKLVNTTHYNVFHKNNSIWASEHPDGSRPVLISSRDKVDEMQKYLKLKKN